MGILRQGRVAAITQANIVFQDGSTAPNLPDSLYVDCSADGLASKPSVPIFQSKRLVLQSVTTCQQVASAAMIAALEMQAGEDVERKNRILQPVPHPNYPRDLFICQKVDHENNQRFIK